jgi:hypothetical protein
MSPLNDSFLFAISVIVVKSMREKWNKSVFVRCAVGCLAEGRESQKISKTLNEREKQKNSKKRTFRVKNTKTKKHE